MERSWRRNITALISWCVAIWVRVLGLANALRVDAMVNKEEPPIDQALMDALSGPARPPSNPPSSPPSNAVRLISLLSSSETQVKDKGLWENLRS